MSTSVCFRSYCGPFDVQNQWSSFIYPGGGVVWQFMTRKGVVSWALHHICLQLSLLPHPIHLKDVNKYESGDFQTLELICTLRTWKESINFRFLVTPMWLFTRKKKLDNITINHLLKHIQISLQAFQWTEFVQLYQELNQREDELSK